MAVINMDTMWIAHKRPTPQERAQDWPFFSTKKILQVLSFFFLQRTIQLLTFPGVFLIFGCQGERNNIMLKGIITVALK